MFSLWIFMQWFARHKTLEILKNSAFPISKNTFRALPFRFQKPLQYRFKDKLKITLHFQQQDFKNQMSPYLTSIKSGWISWMGSSRVWKICILAVGREKKTSWKFQCEAGSVWRGEFQVWMRVCVLACAGESRVGKGDRGELCVQCFLWHSSACSLSPSFTSECAGTCGGSLFPPSSSSLILNR